MTAAQLNQIRDARGDIEKLQERILRLRSAMEGLNRQMGDGSGGGSTVPKDKLAEDMARLDELERRLAARVINFEELLEDMDVWLAGLPEQQRKVMRLRYVDGLKWREVAETAHYSIQHCVKINMTAMKGLPSNPHV